MMFVLIDLNTQLAFLPCYMKFWTEEQFLAWLEIFGEVSRLSETIKASFLPLENYTHTYEFCSWCGIQTRFFYKQGALFIPGTSSRAWQHCPDEITG